MVCILRSWRGTFMSKKSPTGPTEQTPKKPEYLIALPTYIGVCWPTFGLFEASQKVFWGNEMMTKNNDFQQAVRQRYHVFDAKLKLCMNFTFSSLLQGSFKYACLHSEAISWRFAMVGDAWNFIRRLISWVFNHLPWQRLKNLAKNHPTLPSWKVLDNITIPSSLLAYPL